ncbi:anaerobic ribonucleoside-triphosphate reductase activating protein [Desulfococcaceae bacterium OttesenSCG-928-F15]|nr:anaerobic ribonucleoside-triphosphate reductase activating protein [Desulfococcaceae bacterium OttesenSCG-928-F15]
MRIGGLQKNTLIDFPGKIAALVFTRGCNLHCPYCHNPALVSMEGPEAMNENEIFSFLEKRQNSLEGLAITGGEPTLQKDLSEFCARVKAMGYPVKLDTNGSRPEVLKDLIKNRRIDFIAMDIKADPALYFPALSPKNMEEELRESIKIILESGIPHEFRTTCVAPFVTEKMFSAVIPLIRGAERYSLQHFSTESLLDENFFRENGRGLQTAEIDRLADLIRPHVQFLEVR